LNLPEDASVDMDLPENKLLILPDREESPEFVLLFDERRERKETIASV
jgi:hypothetical protein